MKSEARKLLELDAKSLYKNVAKGIGKGLLTVAVGPEAARSVQNAISKFTNNSSSSSNKISNENLFSQLKNNKFKVTRKSDNLIILELKKQSFFIVGGNGQYDLIDPKGGKKENLKPEKLFNFLKVLNKSPESIYK